MTTQFSLRGCAVYANDGYALCQLLAGHRILQMDVWVTMLIV